MSINTTAPRGKAVKKERLLSSLHFQFLEYLFINGVKKPSAENKELYEDMAALGYIRKTRDNAYRVTIKGKHSLLADVYLTNHQLPEPKFFKGDYVTLCHTEYDSDAFDIVFRIQAYRAEASETFITLVDQYNTPVMENGQKTLKGLIVDTEEMSHCLAEEFDSQTRHYEAAY